MNTHSLPYEDTPSSILKVRLGEYDVSTTAEPLRHEEYRIKTIHPHPKVNMLQGKRNNTKLDIFYLQNINF